MSSTSPRRTRQPRMPIEVRREQALDAALALIAEHGYRAVTMEAVAREADFAKPVLYKAYPGLGSLLGALLEREQARGLKALSDAMPPDAAESDPADLLLSWFSSLAHAIADNPGPWRLMLTPPEETPDVVRDRVEAGREFALAQLRVTLQSLLARRPYFNIDPELSAELVLAMAEHAAKLLIRDPERYPPQRLAEFAANVLRTFE